MHGYFSRPANPYRIPYPIPILLRYVSLEYPRINDLKQWRYFKDTSPVRFGYFFSLGIYNRFLEDETLLEDDYIALLRDTASMTTEDLAEKHLNVDLRKPDFWQEALDSVHKDIEEFLELTESHV